MDAALQHEQAPGEWAWKGQEPPQATGYPGPPGGQQLQELGPMQVKCGPPFWGLLKGPGPPCTVPALMNIHGTHCLCHTLCVWFRKTQVHLPNSGYSSDCSGLFFLPFPNLIWACSLKGEVMHSDWPGPSAGSQEMSTSTSSTAQRVTGSASLSKAASPGCVSVSSGHDRHPGRHGAGHRSQKRELGRLCALVAHDAFNEPSSA